MVVPKESDTKQHLLKLMADREKLEAKIAEYGAVLAANGDVGMSGSLVDAEGFPRNDIDVYQVRQARQQIICLQNDHKALMKEIEKWMHKLHAEAAEQQREDITQGTADMQLEHDNSTTNGTSTSNETLVPPAAVFAKVNMVSPGSPAEEAGIRVDDGIIEFGSVNSRNFNNDLNQIAGVVRHMQNQRVPLKVQRMTQQLDLILIPRAWRGRGLLGCNIVLADTVAR